LAVVVTWDPVTVTWTEGKPNRESTGIVTEATTRIRHVPSKQAWTSVPTPAGAAFPRAAEGGREAVTEGRADAAGEGGGEWDAEVDGAADWQPVSAASTNRNEPDQAPRRNLVFTCSPRC
jgi:3-oxoacyl-(acyl-carrier-protein) synthase